MRMIKIRYIYTSNVSSKTKVSIPGIYRWPYPVTLDCPFLIAPLVFSNVYLVSYFSPFLFWFTCFERLLNYLAFKCFNYNRTWLRFFQKHSMQNNLCLYYKKKWHSHFHRIALTHDTGLILRYSNCPNYVELVLQIQLHSCSILSCIE